jgi:hypothetical protein
MKSFACFSVLILFIFSSCEKKEIAVPKHESGDVTTAQVHMGSDYKYQIWFDLGTNSIVKTNLKTDWDISFDCSDTSSWVFLNTSKMMTAAISNSSVFEEVTSRTGLTFNPDHPNGRTDSLGIGNWMTHQKVCIIDRGYDAAANHLGYKKILITALSNNEYQIRYANLNGSAEQSATITKDSLYNTIAFSFNTNQVMHIEPEKNAYDICFSQYTALFYNPFQPYLVTGVVTNPAIRVALDKQVNFDEIDYTQAAGFTFSKAKDVIGYAWKEYDFDNDTYRIYSGNTYIIQDPAGFYYKLHFVDFYDDKGSRGSPAFEFQQL